MAEKTTLARPYAKAAFEYAHESKQLSFWSEALASAALVARDETVAKLLDSPTLTAQQKTEIMVELCSDKFDDKLKAFIAILSENKRLDLIPVIRELFEGFKAQQEKFSDVKVFSAFALNSDIEKGLAEKLKAVLHSDVSLQTTVDPSLLGGVVIRAGDTVIDGSVKGRLNKLAETLGL